jgi:hypothetical protein
MNIRRSTDISVSDPTRLHQEHTTMSSHPEPMMKPTRGADPRGFSARERDYPIFGMEFVALTNARVDQSGVLPRLAAWRSEDAPARRRGSAIVSDRAVLVGLLLLASEHSSLSISSLAEALLHRLSPVSRSLLELPPVADAPTSDPGERRRWIDITRQAFNRMLAVMDPFPQTGRMLSHAAVKDHLDAHDPDRERKMKLRLDEFTQGFLDMTYAQQPRHIRRASDRIDLSVGEIFIGSPTRAGFSRNNLAANVAAEESTDPRSRGSRPVDVFAGWHAQTGHPNSAGIIPKPVGKRGADKKAAKRWGWGWSATIAVRVDSGRHAQDKFPNLAVGATLSLPHTDAPDAAVSVMRAALSADHDAWLKPGIVDTDLFASTHVDRLHKPTFELGFTPSREYRDTELGMQGVSSGAEFIEGKAYCPGMPQVLKSASADRRDNYIDDETYRKRLEARVPYEFRLKGKPDHRGRYRVICPPAGANPTVTCPLRETHSDAANRNRTHIDATDLPDYPDKACIQQTVTFDQRDGLRQRQAFTYQSAEWDQFRGLARGAFESLSAGISDPHRENVTDVSRRNVSGLAASQVFVTVLLTNYNLRAIAAFINDQTRADAASDAVELERASRRGERE